MELMSRFIQLISILLPYVNTVSFSFLTIFFHSFLLFLPHSVTSRVFCHFRLSYGFLFISHSCSVILVSTGLLSLIRVYVRAQNCRKRLLASPWLSFRPLVRPSARNNSALTRRILVTFYIANMFLKHIDQIQVWLKSDTRDRRIT
jgi:hypothetical protein